MSDLYELQNEFTLIKVNDTILNQWYDPTAVCMIKTATNTSIDYWDYLDICKAKYNNTYQWDTGFATLASSTYSQRYRGICCNGDMAVSDRGFDEVIEGFEDPNQKYILDLFLQLSYTNKSLMLLGDSMNNQVWSALFIEVQRENIKGQLNHLNFRDRWWVQNFSYYESTVGATTKTLNYVAGLYEWIPPVDEVTNQPLYRYRNVPVVNKVYFYTADLWYFDAAGEEYLLTHHLIPAIIKNDHPSGIVLYANIGHHLANERTHPSAASINTKISDFLNWLHGLAIENPNTIPVFRETTPSHFDSNKNDGSYETWKDSSNSHYNYLEPNSWDGTLYYCRAAHSYESMNNSGSVIAPDTELVTTSKGKLRILTTRENHAVRSILKTWTSSKVSVLTVYKYLLPFYKLKYGHCGRFTRIDVIDCVHQCGFSPLAWQPIWFEMANHVRKYSTDLTISSQSVFAVAINDDLISSNEEMFKEGKVEPLPLQNKHNYKTRPEANILRKVPNSVDNYINETLVRKEFYEDKYYILNHGLRQEIPDLKSAEALLRRKVDVVYNLTAFQLLQIPEGWPVKVFKYNEGSLVKGGGPTIYRIENGMKRSIPDWNTFLKLNFDMNQVQIINDKDLESIPTGDTLPSLN